MSGKKLAKREPAMQPRDFSSVLKNAPPGEWVALSQDRKRIAGTGKTLKEAFEAAKAAGEKTPLMIKMPACEEGVAAAVR